MTLAGCLLQITEDALLRLALRGQEILDFATSILTRRLDLKLRPSSYVGRGEGEFPQGRLEIVPLETGVTDVASGNLECALKRRVHRIEGAGLTPKVLTDTAYLRAVGGLSLLFGLE